MGAVGKGGQSMLVLNDDLAAAQADEVVPGKVTQRDGGAFASSADQGAELLVGEPNRLVGSIARQLAEGGGQAFTEELAGQIGQSVFEIGDAGGQLFGDAQGDAMVGEHQLLDVDAAHQTQLDGFQGSRTGHH